MKTVLGKITKVAFGFHQDYPFLFGFKLEFRCSDGFHRSTGDLYRWNISDEYIWKSPDEKQKLIEGTMSIIQKTMKDANVQDMALLIGCPVEIFIEDESSCSFKSFRILTEVI